MEREKLKTFTTISLYIALVTIIVLPAWYYISASSSNNNISSILPPFPLMAFYLSLFGIPLSIISMFSHEKLVKRLFVLLVNLAPLSLIIYAVLAEFVDGFFRTAP